MMSSSNTLSNIFDYEYEAEIVDCNNQTLVKSIFIYVYQTSDLLFFTI